MSGRVRSVDINVRVGIGSTSVILYQRGAKFNSDRAKEDLTVKSDYPNKKYAYSWHDGSIECDGLLEVGTDGFADLYKLQMDPTDLPCDIVFVMGDTGEEFAGQALMTNLTCDAPQDKEPTFSCKLEKTGEWLPTTGA